MSSSAPPLNLTRESVEAAHNAIRQHIHETPLLTNSTLSAMASTPQSEAALASTPWAGRTPARPKMRLLFKCENFQRGGAFKARGAFHAMSRLSPDERRAGVVTHSSGNFAQALALAAREIGPDPDNNSPCPAYIVMPGISSRVKIAATKGYGGRVTFSGSTGAEREAVAAELMAAHPGATLVPPYDHADIILGQGTVGLEAERQAQELLLEAEQDHDGRQASKGANSASLDALISPVGGGGLISGIATALAPTPIRVFGAEPSLDGADDCARGLAHTPAPERIEHVKTATIADGLRTPVGILPWKVITGSVEDTKSTGSLERMRGKTRKVDGVFAVTEEQIRAAMKLVFERMKLVVEPSAVVGLAVVLFHEGFRKRIEELAEGSVWNVCIILSGGNTTIDAIRELFSEQHSHTEPNGLHANSS